MNGVLGGKAGRRSNEMARNHLPVYHPASLEVECHYTASVRIKFDMVGVGIFLEPGRLASRHGWVTGMDMDMGVF